ncbi:MAG: polyprenyl synthetase [Nitrospirae bacterium RIFCSPLOW2_12_42_9]|nr:MAG: polyprenyl synthetase [Nitrospirae bacterium GWA2_42_11]OGW55849.1 MAG: polyprenyl synthetase [Nitrospirae bacterium RIFCSPHIGHO2_02_FULL_42_12]OGW56788.1 MAG: polyprenyl synthetase [Nitrospirae bacterium RIFCSPLOW2_12_42_9]HAS17718.1 polyprenyl synthetase [Nitrospiraceae bacterium]
MPLSQYIDKYKAIIEENLLRLLGPSEITPVTLYQSMHYSLFAGGKRIRSILCIASAEAVGGAIGDVIHIASAIEMIHTYSLIHDDLPSMDNDDLRRGKPTNHKVFGEATAILAGDALLTLAFTTLSDISVLSNIPPEKALHVINEIALSSGHYGMVGGQQIDMESQGKRIDISSLEQMHMKKTGALIRASVRSGGIVGGAAPPRLLALTEYGENIGHAFQIADDILDVEGSIEDVGKTIGKDIAQNKNTYPAMIGLDESKALEKSLIDRAIEALNDFDESADPLRMIAKYIVERKR